MGPSEVHTHTYTQKLTIPHSSHTTKTCKSEKVQAGQHIACGRRFVRLKLRPQPE